MSKENKLNNHDDQNYDSQHDDSLHYESLRYDQHNDSQHNDSQHNDSQHHDSQHSDSQHHDSHHHNSHHHGSHHHHQHSHRRHHYDGPRSHQADNLSDEYNITLTEDFPDKKPEEEIIDLVFDDDFPESEEMVKRTAQREEDSRRQSSKKRKHRKHRDSWTRRNRRSRILINILLAVAALLVLIILGFFILRYLGEKKLAKNVVETPVQVELPEEVEKEDDVNLVVYNGERYWYNEDIITVLCLGIDRESFVSPDEMIIGGNGQADADVLMVIDKKTGKISLLNISRDCNVEIDRFNTDGQYIDTKKEQLCLSFAFGDGKKTSCENTALSVSRLLYGMPINAYVAIDFESVGILNDSVGGVSVPITEDIAADFPGATVGSTVNLVGSEAITYIRKRDTSQLDSNNVRMSRQKTYLLAFIKKAIAQLKSDPTKAISLYKAISDNMVTSVKLSEVTYFGSLFARYGIKEQNLFSLKGEVVEDEEGFALFLPDENALYETVLELFYIKE